MAIPNYLYHKYIRSANIFHMFYPIFHVFHTKKPNVLWKITDLPRSYFTLRNNLLINFYSMNNNHKTYFYNVIA